MDARCDSVPVYASRALPECSVRIPLAQRHRLSKSLRLADKGKKDSEALTAGSFLLQNFSRETSGAVVKCRIMG